MISTERHWNVEPIIVTLRKNQRSLKLRYNYYRFNPQFMAVDEVLRRFRLENQLTQEDMAYLLGISQAAYYKWERNITKIPLERYNSIAVTCRIKLIDILPEEWRDKLMKEDRD